MMLDRASGPHGDEVGKTASHVKGTMVAAALLLLAGMLGCVPATIPYEAPGPESRQDVAERMALTIPAGYQEFSEAGSAFQLQTEASPEGEVAMAWLRAPALLLTSVGVARITGDRIEILAPHATPGRYSEVFLGRPDHGLFWHADRW